MKKKMWFYSFHGNQGEEKSENNRSVVVLNEQIDSAFLWFYYGFLLLLNTAADAATA